MQTNFFPTTINSSISCFTWLTNSYIVTWIVNRLSNTGNQQAFMNGDNQASTREQYVRWREHINNWIGWLLTFHFFVRNEYWAYVFNQHYASLYQQKFFDDSVISLQKICECNSDGRTGTFADKWIQWTSSPCRIIYFIFNLNIVYHHIYIK